MTLPPVDEDLVPSAATVSSDNKLDIPHYVRPLTPAYSSVSVSASTQSLTLRSQSRVISVALYGSVILNISTAQIVVTVIAIAASALQLGVGGWARFLCCGLWCGLGAVPTVWFGFALHREIKKEDTAPAGHVTRLMTSAVCATVIAAAALGTIVGGIAKDFIFCKAAPMNNICFAWVGIGFVQGFASGGHLLLASIYGFLAHKCRKLSQSHS